ncbi:MAG: hypothetical protein PHY93_13135 [Bacteriovorax sp.]|nr:hypothetical protein [Bacteriovorax sp.]
MKISVVSYSLSSQPSGLKEWKEDLCNEIKSFISNGSEVILYPELFLMGLSDYFKAGPKEQLAKISTYIEKDLLPSLESILIGHNILLVLGTGPRFFNENYYNSAPLWIDGRWIFQDKLHLTPWEKEFIPGNSIQLISFKGLKTAVIICFDIEQPGLTLKLKEQGVHFVLVPSATINKNGNQRVNRCASARSVELGAAVLTVPLVGDSACDLVDHNEGRQALFLPPQEIVQCQQEIFSDYSISKQVIAYYFVDEELLVKIKVADDETKPYLTKDNSKIEIIKL